MKLLAQFKIIHSVVDFCLPELKSLISMHGLDWKNVFQHEFEGEETEIIDESKLEGDAVSTNSEQKTQILPKNLESEASSLHTEGYYVYQARKLTGKGIQKDPMPKNPIDISHTSFVRFPFVFLEFPSLEIAQSIVSRSILLDVCLQLISEGGDYEELITRVDHEVLDLHNQPDEKIIFEVDPFNSHLTRPEMIQRINLITDRLGMWGKINLKTPSKRFWVMERHIDSYTKHTDNSVQSTLLDIFFGIEICRSNASSRSTQKENFFLRYDLKNRVYLGPTSTDNLLSFLMSNQGQSQIGSLVLDPFVGTGSLLIPASHFGAICFGSDLDPRVLHGFGVGRVNTKSDFFASKSLYCTTVEPKIMLNFEQYALEQPTIIRMDCMNTNLRESEVFDAIVCDPPYGIRAMTRTSNKNGKKKSKKSQRVDSRNNKRGGEVEDSDVKNIMNQPGDTTLTCEQSKQIIESALTCQNKKNNTQKTYDEEDDFQDERVPSTVDNRSINTTVSELEEIEVAAENLTIAEWPGRFCPSEVISVDQIVKGLFALANRVLIPGGRLVFLYPIERKNFSKLELIKNLLDFPNFAVIDIAENILNEKKGRVLITMQKIQTATKTEETSSSLLNPIFDNSPVSVQQEISSTL